MKFRIKRVMNEENRYRYYPQYQILWPFWHYITTTRGWLRIVSHSVEGAEDAIKAFKVRQRPANKVTYFNEHGDKI
jgi:hypothetical protein